MSAPALLYDPDVSDIQPSITVGILNPKLLDEGSQLVKREHLQVKSHA